MLLDREKILDSCLKVFAKFGFHKASIADIVRPLGVTKAAIYHHFPGGKEEMFFAVIGREERRVLDKMRAAISAGDPPERQLRCLLLAKLNHFQTLRRLLDVPLTVGEEVARIYAGREASFHEAERNLIAGILRTGQKMNRFRKRDPDGLASLIQRIQHHLELPLVFERDRKSMEKFVDEVLEILLHGIAEPCAVRSA